jgi:branched-subunit amino acid aminotransferase/4-amino-4-deoxychorismate lyase
MPNPPVHALATEGREDVVRWLRYGEPLAIVAAERAEDVMPLLAEVRRQTERGRVAVGWIAYEAAPAFDAALAVRPPGQIPLAWFAIFARGEHAAAPEDVVAPQAFRPAWEGAPSPAGYREAVARIHGHIAAGETYQVNYTYRLRAPWDGGAPLDEVLRAIFPSASITGAPKVRTMRIIADLERTPRGIYTGCVGVLGPGRRAWMNVAIRTLVVDRRRSLAEYGTGSGIVWDSQAKAELAECRTKTLVLGGIPPPFGLLETLAWVPGEGFLLLERHLRRLAASADYFDFAYDERTVRERLDAAVRGLRGAQRVRLVIDERGGTEVGIAPLGARAVRLGDGPPARHRRALRVGLAREPVRRDNPFLYHKTTRRDVYEDARAGRPECDEVILWNAEGEVTEATIANVVLRDAAGYWTPPVESGLLEGTFRAELLERGVIRERRIDVGAARAARELWLISSVRGWRRCHLVD